MIGQNAGIVVLAKYMFKWRYNAFLNEPLLSKKKQYFKIQII